MSDLVGTPTIDASASPETGTSASVNGTDNQGGEASQSATNTESFIPQGVDLNTLPPHLRSHIEKINNDMVRGFTEKTTKLSETIKSEAAKAAEAFKSKAELYDQIATQEEFVNQWNEYVKKVQSTPTSEQSGDPALNEMKAQLQEMSQKMQISEMSQVTDAFADAVNEKGEKLHPQFDELNNFNIGQLANGKGQEDYSLLRACIELAPGKTPSEKLANGYKTAKATYDAIFENGKKAGMGRINQKVLNGSTPPSNSSGNPLSITDKKPKSAREAMEMARKGQMVSRD